MPNILSLGMFPEEHFYHFKVKLWANLFDNKSLSSKKERQYNTEENYSSENLLVFSYME